MAGPPQGPATSASDRTPYSSRSSGAGGKIRSRHQNSLQDRRAITSSSVDNRDPVAAAARAGGAIRRGPYDRPAQGRHSSAGPLAAVRKTAWSSMGSRIFNGASSFLSSFFRKEVVDFELQDAVLDRNDSDADEIEDILKERAFTTEQCDHLIQVLQSKMNARSTQPLQNHIPNGLIEDRYPDDELEREHDDVRERERQREGIPDATTVGDELGSSPVDIAKAYMDKRLSPVPLPVRTLDYGATRIREEYGATPPRVATPGHTPYVKLHRNKIFDASSRRTPYQVPASIVREKKRRVEDDSDYSGRRTRLKTSAAANGPPLSTLPSTFNDVGNGSYMSRMRNLQRLRADKSATEDIVGVAPVPTQSTETARRILETLEMLTPPKVKSLEEELVMVREKRPKELSPSMLNEQARKSMQDVECPSAEIATTSTYMEPVTTNRIGKPSSSSEAPPPLPMVQPVASDVKGKGVKGVAMLSEAGPSLTAPTAQPTKGFRMNAALEESNSDDETPAPAPKKVSFSITTKPSEGLSKSGFTFPSANLLTEPPTPKPMPSPALHNEHPKTSPDKAAQPIMEKSASKESDSPAVSQNKPVDLPSSPSTPVSNGPEDGSKGAGNAPSVFTTPPKAILNFPATNTENTPSLFGLTKPTMSSILSDSNGILHKNNALGPPAEEALKSGQGSAAAVSTALSSDTLANGLFNFVSSSSFGASAPILDTKPVVSAPEAQNKSIFGFVSSTSSPVLESKPPITFSVPSSSAAAEPISKTVTSGSESKPTVTENKPISSFGLSTPAFPFHSSSSFGSTLIAPSSSSPETTAAPLTSSSSSPVLFSSGTSPFPSFSSGPSSSTPFPAFNSDVFGSNTASNTNTSSSSASFVFSASSGSASTGMPFGATNIFGVSTSASTSGATVSTFTFGAQSTGLASGLSGSGAGSKETTSTFVFGGSNVFTGFGSSPAPSSVSSPTGDMMEDMAEEPSQAGANTMQPSISQPPSLFESTPAQTPGQPFVFGGNQTASLFGGSQPAFGAPQSQPSTLGFGSQPSFGAQPAPTGGSQTSFGAQAAPTIGSQPSSASSFGAQPAAAFGAPSFGAQPFGAAPAFGAQPAAAPNPFASFSGVSGGFSMGAGSTEGEQRTRKLFKAKRTGAAKRGK